MKCDYVFIIETLNLSYMHATMETPSYMHATMETLMGMADIYSPCINHPNI